MTPLALVLATSIALPLAVLPMAQPQPQPQKLKFGWPAGTVARVETERTRERRTGTKPAETTRFSAAYRMRVLPDARGLLIKLDDYELLEPRLLPSDADAASQLLSSVVPSLVVRDDGTFVGIDDIAPLQRMMEELMARVRANAGDMPGLKDLASRLASPPVLTSLSSQEWSGLVGAWLDLPLAAGQAPFESEESSPAFPGLTMPLKGTIGMVSRAPCTRLGTTYECATLELSSALDPKAMKQLLERLMEGAKGMPDFSSARYDIRTVMRVTLETGTMLPHAFEMTKTVQMDATIQGEKMQGGQVERRTTRFAYLAPK